MFLIDPFPDLFRTNDFDTPRDGSGPIYGVHDPSLANSSAFHFLCFLSVLVPSIDWIDSCLLGFLRHYQTSLDVVFAFANATFAAWCRITLEKRFLTRMCIRHFCSAWSWNDRSSSVLHCLDFDHEVYVIGVLRRVCEHADICSSTYSDISGFARNLAAR